MKKTMDTVLIAMLALCFLWVVPAPANTASAEASPGNIFASLPERFCFASGAGGWWTDVYVHADGTFTGLYEDNDMGGIGEGYPNGTKYECRFSGAFTDVKKIGEFEYSMRIASLQTEGVLGEEQIIDGVKVVTAEPYGFDHANEFLLYLPGKETANLPKEYVGWIRGPVSWVWENYEMPATLPFHGLYNIGGEMGFFSYDAIEEAVNAPQVISYESSSYTKGYITVEQSAAVSLRNRPSEDGNPLCRLSPGASYPCVGQDASTWYKVFADGYIGYAPTYAVSYTRQDKAPSGDVQQLGIVQITSNDFANIRSRPSANSDWVAGVSPGIVLDYVGVAENGWYCVLLPNQETGYVSNKLCDIR